MLEPDTNHKIIQVTPLRRIFWHEKTFNNTINEFLSQLRSNHNLYCRFCASFAWKLIFHLLLLLIARGSWINLYRFCVEGCWQTTIHPRKGLSTNDINSAIFSYFSICICPCYIIYKSTLKLSRCRRSKFEGKARG